MANSRLTLAIEAGSVVLPPKGDIAVLNAGGATDLTALPKDKVTVFQGFFPDYQALKDREYRIQINPVGKYSAAIVLLPRSKQRSRNLIQSALSITDGGPVVIDGQKTDGIESILKECRAQGGNISGVFSKAHGKVFTLSGGDFVHWAADGPAKNADGFLTQAGLFSADGIDRGSAVLAAALPDKLEGKVADLGAGWGFLSHHILKRSGVTECHLVEAEHGALACAKLNVQDEKARFHWGDARTFSVNNSFDHIVTNPPFHTGRAPDPELGRAFIAATVRLLSRRGVVWLVANRQLPYEQSLSASFKEVAEVAGDTSFKVFRAALARPRTS